jgi:hypothetical protein
MHDDELEIDAGPRPAAARGGASGMGGPSARARSAPGTDDAIFRLGDDLAVRLPKNNRVLVLEARMWLREVLGDRRS